MKLCRFLTGFGQIGLVLLFFACFSSLVQAETPIEHSGVIGAHETWAATSVHHISGTVDVAVGVNLIIEPGAIVKLSPGTSLNVKGALSAIGTVGDKIVFTSYKDDSVGGDTNGDGPSQGSAGDWQRIYFTDQVTDSLTRLEHTVIRYGGGNSSNLANVYIDQANISIVNSEISHSSRDGVHIQRATPLLDGNAINDNVRHGIYVFDPWNSGDIALIRNNSISRNEDGIHSDYYAQPQIEGNTITDNRGWGFYQWLVSDLGIFKDNTITGNERSARIPASAAPSPADGNILVPNRINGLWLLGNARDTDLRLSIQSGGGEELNSYWIDNLLTMSTGTTLTVDPGVIVKFASNGGLTINGTLRAQGTASDKIVFTSYADDKYGGDMNADGNGSAPANGDWKSIYFSNQAVDGASLIEHAVVKYAGGSNSSNIYSDSTDLSIRHSDISNSSGHGVRGYAANLIFSDNEIYANNSDGIRLEGNASSVTISGSRLFANLSDGIEITSQAAVTASGNEIFGNLDYGILNVASNPNEVDASDVWWGAADGPGGVQAGSGDEVSDNVAVSGLFSSFRTEGSLFSYFNAGPNLSEGSVSGPVVTQGSASEEWGSSPWGSVLYDLERVTLDYSAVDATRHFDLFVAYLNEDNTSGIGGNRQSLFDGNGQLIH
ncbi:right-handed parallel beta-helix repeat-containing protein, partial [Pseudomonadota bacterium]